MTEHARSAHAAAAPPVPLVPLRELVPWLAFAGTLLVLQLWLAGVEQGATSVLHGASVHEYLHDARHLLGLPCN